MRGISEERLKNLAKRNSGPTKMVIEDLLRMCVVELGEIQVQTQEEKNQAAIDHVASVSKHPHAAMICKWLVTGWDVVYKGRKDKLKQPYWSKDYEYELIEPPEPKPAYRVYKHTGCEGTCTQDRYPNGSLSHKPADSGTIEWLSDWIEYDPGPKRKWPTPLVERIAAVNLTAAEWIVEHWDELLTPKYTNDGCFSRESDTLKKMFRWLRSDVPFDVWENIATELGE